VVTDAVGGTGSTADETDNIDERALFDMLPSAHRDKFLAALQNPESAEAKALLDVAAQQMHMGGGGPDGEYGPEDEDEDAEDMPSCMPWWNRPSVLDSAEDPVADSSGVEQGEQGGDKLVLPDRAYAELPDLVDEEVLRAVKVPEGTGVKLRYNAVAIGYVF
jgi:hypothetical protein